MILDDADSGTPARYLWLPTNDPGAPPVRPEEPDKCRGWSLAKSVGNPDDLDPSNVRPMDVCRTAWDEVDSGSLSRLWELGGDALDSHALLCRLKTAAALALLECRIVITEEDWRLAAIVHDISNATRQRMIDTLQRSKIKHNQDRAVADAHRAVIVEDKLAERAITARGTGDHPQISQH